MTTKYRAIKIEAIMLAAAIENEAQKLMAAGNDEVAATQAAVEMAKLYNDNWQFIVWALRTAGQARVAGAKPPMPEPRRKQVRHSAPSLPSLPAFLADPAA